MKPLADYPTPLTDAQADHEWRHLSTVPASHARDIERKLAMCRHALRDISTYCAMQTHSAGRVISEDAKDIATEALDATR